MLKGPVAHPDLLLQQRLPGRRTSITQYPLQAIQRVHGETIPIRLVPNRQLERRVDVTLLAVSANVHVDAAGALVRQAVDEEWVAMEVEDDGLVLCEDGGVVGVGETVRVVGGGDELEEVNDVDEADLQFREVVAEEGDGSEGFLR